jgi:uncharacterized protein RhaS with RHS repeats
LSLGIVGGFNTYGYVGGNPIAANDPSGLIAPQVFGAVIGLGSNLASQLGSNGGNFCAVNISQLATAGLVGALLPGIGSAATNTLLGTASGELSAALAGIAINQISKYGNNTGGPTGPSPNLGDLFPGLNNLPSIWNWTDKSGPYTTGPGVIPRPRN